MPLIQCSQCSSRLIQFDAERHSESSFLLLVFAHRLGRHLQRRLFLSSRKLAKEHLPDFFYTKRHPKRMASTTFKNSALVKALYFTSNISHSIFWCSSPLFLISFHPFSVSQNPRGLKRRQYRQNCRFRYRFWGKRKFKEAAERGEYSGGARNKTFEPPRNRKGKQDSKRVS